MNGYENIIESIFEWAKRVDNIRAVIMIGSRARDDGKADEWSDLDLIVIAEDISEYIQTTSWTHAFGAPLVSFTETAFDGTVERRVLYEGFLDVDFDFCDPDQYIASLEIGEIREIFRRGYLILLDKDDWSSRTAKAGGAAQREGISSQTILNEIHDYWFHCVWTAKKLKRGELWTALNCLNCYMKGKLLRMLEHQAFLSEGKTDEAWYAGRFLEKWAAPAIVRRLPGSFSDYDGQAMILALQHQMAVYDEAAVEVAAHHGITYPTDEIRTIKDWILKLGDTFLTETGRKI